MKKYKSYAQHQYQLLPPNLEELIEPKHLVRVVDQFVSTLSSKIYDDSFTGGGAPAYHPKMMLKIILYAYSSKIYSCRQIAKATRENIPFMWLAGMKQPNFNTINRFRTDYFRNILETIFTQLLDFLYQKEYISFNDFFVDGTKVEANAGRYTHVWKKNTQRYKAALQKRVKQLFCDIDALNALEDEKYNEADLPERGESVQINSQEIKTATEKLNEKIVSNNDKKKQRLLKSKIKTLNKEADKLAQYERQEHILEKRNSYSKTDHDATFMRLKDNRLRAAYNVQISSENQFITNYSISQNAADSIAFPPHLHKLVDRGSAYLPDNYMGDSAYGNEENFSLLEYNNIDNYLKYNTFHSEKKKKPSFHRDHFSYDQQYDRFKCPIGKYLFYQQTIQPKTKTGFITHVRIYECLECQSCSYKIECTKAKGNRTIYYNPILEDYKSQARGNLHSEYGICLRKSRGSQVETPFADLKHNQGFRRFYLRGLPKVEHEFGLVCIGYNLRKVAGKMTQSQRNNEKQRGQAA